MKAHIFLTFDGECEQAFEFYKSVFGGEFKMKMTFGESPEKEKCANEFHHHIMYVSLPLEHMELMGCDKSGDSLLVKKFCQGTNFHVVLTPTSRDEADTLYHQLTANGGKQDQPMVKTFWGSYFGTLTDRFGVQWMIECVEEPIEPNKELVRKAAEKVRALIKVTTDLADELEAIGCENPPQKKAKLT